MNDLAMNDYDEFPIAGQYHIRQGFDPLTLLNRVIREQPLRILMHEALLAHLRTDPRVIVFAPDVVAVTGNWGRINGVRISCYSKQFVNREHKILLYKEKRSKNTCIRVMV